MAIYQPPLLRPDRRGGSTPGLGISANPTLVPPSPTLLVQLYTRFQELQEARLLPGEMTFEEYFAVWSASRRSEDEVGLDDGAARLAPTEEPQLIERPPRVLAGVIRTIV